MSFVLKGSGLRTASTSTQAEERFERWKREGSGFDKKILSRWTPF
jgi:hypothetical protein